ncbi:MAG: hypothetical protein L3J39_17260 [Verrucomicrobiales bacterium]|nr:hypothetical protein [Verrucomicrobiales bacterium]
MKIGAIVCVLAGALIAVFAFLDLQKSGLGAYHKNPFALRQSGYGTILARLGQLNLDRAWHYGALASELSQSKTKDPHAGHDHAEHELEEGAEEGDGDHAGHDHDGESEVEALATWVTPALNFLVDLDAQRFSRTYWYELSKQQSEEVARDIEAILLKGYNMDPTDYGVYNAYFHFLIYHELRRKESDRKRAYQMSEYTIQVAFKNKEDPMPWLTATTATLNQFFMHQQDYRREKADVKAALPVDVIVKYQDRMKYCLGHYFKLRDQAVEDGRWRSITAVRREETERRAELGMKMMEQFQAMIDREGGTTSKEFQEKIKSNESMGGRK